ncbi:MAG: hypothetical protein ACTS5A_01295 [Candidatus Hodgkinia cicadicola]
MRLISLLTTSFKCIRRPLHRPLSMRSEFSMFIIQVIYPSFISAKGKCKRTSVCWKSDH